MALADRPDDEREFLMAIDENAGAFLASAFIQSASFLFLAAVLFYLYRATKARKPEFPVIALVIAVLGPILLAIAGPLSDISRLDIADEFLSSGPQSEARAEDLLEDRSVPAAAVGSAGTLALAIAFVLININAMRVGLLSRFMGVIGAIVGGLYVLPILSGPLIVQLFWLLALGVLFLGHWPGGRGPAWETGRGGSVAVGRRGARQVVRAGRSAAGERRRARRGRAHPAAEAQAQEAALGTLEAFRAPSGPECFEVSGAASFRSRRPRRSPGRG